MIIDEFSSVMIGSSMFCNLCVGKFIWFLSPKLSKVSMISNVSGLEIAFLGMLKSPIISKSSHDVIFFPDNQLAPERTVAYSLLVTCILFQNVVKAIVM